MIKTTRILLCLASLLLLCASCGRHRLKGEGSIVTEDRPSRNISRIDISAPVQANVYIIPGSTPSVRITGYQNLLSHIKTKFEGNMLNVYSSNLVRFDTDTDVVVDITVSSISGLAIHGASEARMKGALKGNDFSLRISGAGSAWIEQLELDKLKASISGAGNVKIASGTVDNGTFVVSGAGSIEAFGVNVNNATARISGAGDIELTAIASLDAHASGAGNVHYKGHPAVRKQKSGAGDIEEAN
jgi:hypothetical protein